MVAGKRFSVLVVVVVALGIVAAADSALAQQSGDPVVVLIPADANQPEPPRATDRLIFTGGRVASIDTSGCQPGSFPVQSAILVDTTGGRSGRIVGIITTSTTDPFPPGTKVNDLILVSSCTILATGDVYNRYVGTVE